MSSDLAAFALAVVAAVGVAKLDLGTSAWARGGLNAEQARAAALEQGFEGGAQSTELRYDRVERDFVWEVSGESERVTVNAATGDLLAAEF